MPPNSDRQPASARARFHPALVSIVVSVDPAMQRASRIVDALRDIARADLTPLVDKPDDEFMPEDRRLCAMAKMAVIALDQGVTEERIAELEPAFLDEYGRFAEKARWVLQLLVDSLSVREAHAAGRELAFEARPDQLARMDAVFSQLSPEAQEAIDKVALEAKDGFHPSQVLPTLDELRLAHTWVTRRYQLSGRRDDLAFTRILAEAHALALDEGDEVAALFFSMARRGKALTDYWGPLTDTVVNAQLHARGRRLTKEGIDALRGLRTEVAANAVKFEDVCDWFAQHTEPITSSSDEQ